MTELRAGATVGRFRLEREVARGGMGAVWAARDPSARDRLVALKTVIAAKSSKKLAQLFVEEARIARAVRHPNLVELYEAGEDHGVPYLAMEWVEGLTLRALAEGSLPLAVVLRICMEACDGLHAVHEARTDDGTPLHIVHRDVSPHNLLVSIAGRVKVIDFGIAKARGRIASETTDGVLRGKVRYMAPEHARGAPIDRRADIWSLGVTLLEVTTGTTPFAAEHDVATLVRLLSTEPTIPDHPSLPAPVKRIVERALLRDPDDRYPTARDMGTDLEAAIAALGEKVTRRDVARTVRSRIENAHTQALRVPSFAGDDDEDGAPTELIFMPRARKPELETVSELAAAPPAPTVDRPPMRPPLASEDPTLVRPPLVAAARPSAAPRPRANLPPLPTPPAFAPVAPVVPVAPVLTEEDDLTDIRPVDVVVPGAGERRSSFPPASSSPAATAPPAASSPPAASTSPAASSPSVAPAPLAASPSTLPLALASLEGAPPAVETAKDVGGAKTHANDVLVPPRAGSRAVPVLAASLVIVFFAIAALVAAGARGGDDDTTSPSSSAVDDEAIAIEAVRSAAPVDAGPSHKKTHR